MNNLTAGEILGSLPFIPHGRGLTTTPVLPLHDYKTNGLKVPTNASRDVMLKVPIPIHTCAVTWQGIRIHTVMGQGIRIHTVTGQVTPIHTVTGQGISIHTVTGQDQMKWMKKNIIIRNMLSMDMWFMIWPTVMHPLFMVSEDRLSALEYTIPCDTNTGIYMTVNLETKLEWGCPNGTKYSHVNQFKLPQ